MKTLDPDLFSVFPPAVVMRNLYSKKAEVLDGAVGSEVASQAGVPVPQDVLQMLSDACTETLAGLTNVTNKAIAALDNIDNGNGVTRNMLQNGVGIASNVIRDSLESSSVIAD